MKKIPLTNGGVALVDNEDYNYLIRWKWRMSTAGYAYRGVRIEGKPRHALMHRQIMGAKKGQQIDHINNTPLDNRRENLRFCTNAQNMRNRKLSKRNKTGHRGVTIGDNRKKYRARISANGRAKHLGVFETVEEASEAYNLAAQAIDPIFWKLNEQ